MDRASKKTKFPAEIRSGNVVVNVYEGQSGGLPFYTVVFKEAGRRVRRGFRQPTKALQEAQRIADQLASGRVKAAGMKDTDAAEYGSATILLRELGEAAPGVLAAVREYVEAAKVLKGGSVIEAARFYAARRPTAQVTISVADAVEEFLKAKESDGVGARYLQDARSRLRRFAVAFSAPLSSLTTATMEKWLRAVAEHPRTRNNFRQHLVTLFRWARDRGYLPREAQTEADCLPLAKDRGSDVETFTPDAIAKLLSAADDTLRPYLAIRAFAGVRDSEMRRLTWENVRDDQGVIEIRAGQAKTAARRLIPILPNLAAWLGLCKNRKGRIGYFNSERIARAVAASAGVEWVHNGLRHGFGTHRLAVTKNAAQVAHEMGNTERMVHAHYKELVTEAQGLAWFAISPDQPENVINIKSEAAA